MAIIDGDFVFGLPAITNSTAATASTNTYDAGSDKNVFGGQNVAKLIGRFPVTADASPTVKVDFVASDAADLDPNGNEAVPNIVLASTGVISTDEDGNALASGDVVDFQLDIGGQTAERQYYGCIITLGGTSPDTVADAKQLSLVLTAQTNLPGARAAVPA
jgi:hypothetical protein